VACRPTGWHCTTAAAVVEQLRNLAQRLPDHQIAARLNALGVPTQTGKTWTYRRVASMRKRYQIPTACPVGPAAHAERGDGLLPVALAAERLGVSPSLVHLWAAQGIVQSDQRAPASFRWVRLTAADVVRLDGRQNWSQYPTVRELMRQTGWSREAVWARVRAGEYLAYRHRAHEHWEWRLACVAGTAPAQQALMPLPALSGEQ
jgi:hypothetical protein